MAFTLGLLWFSAALADTIHMQSGVKFDGVVLREEGDRLVVQVDKRTVRVQKNEVATVEKNDKDGSFNREAAKQAAAERDRQITEETGLTAEERRAIDEHLRALTDPDPVVRGEAKRALLAMASEKNLFPYLEKMLVSMLPWSVPAVLSILAEVDPTAAQPIIRSFTTATEENARAAAVELLGITLDKASLSLMMRGLLDHTVVVRLAACTALAAIGAKEATPMLIDNLSHADLSVKKYAHEALSAIWSEGETKVAFDAVEEWNTFWEGQRANTPGTVDIQSLEPLVPPDTKFEYC